MRLSLTTPSANSPDSDQKYIARLVSDVSQLGASGRVYLDFDQTLFLWNSTEAFLNEARPSIVFAPLLKGASGLIPWNFIGKNGYFIWRDCVRLALVMLLAPWTLARFARAAPAIYARERNTLLESALADIDLRQVVIVSFGWRRVIRALLKGSHLEGAEIIAPGLFGLATARSKGKLAMLAREGYNLDRSKDVVVTDSARDDADLLNAVHQQHVIHWSAENKTAAHWSAYFPFFYTARIKRSPGFLVKQVFLEELPIVLIMFATLHVPSILPVLFCLSLLFIAYLLVYEIGYAENDRVGERTEAQPKLSDAYFTYRHLRLEPDAWIWAALVTLAAFALAPADLRQSMLTNLHLGGVPADFGIAVLTLVWMAFLGLARAVYYVFNKVPLAWRVFVYLPLHATKYFGPLLLLPIHPAGVALGLAQVVRTWSMYAIRRAGGDEHALSSQMVRLTFFAAFAVVVFSIAELTWDEGFLLALAFAFCIIRAAPEVKKKMFGAAAKLGRVL